jgi:hypothetical protein
MIDSFWITSDDYPSRTGYLSRPAQAMNKA